MAEENFALVNIKPQKDEAVIALHEQSLRLEHYANELAIDSDDKIKSATNDLSIISGLKKAIEEKRKEYTQPINEHLKAVNEAFKNFTIPLTNADAITRQKILAYRLKQDLIRKEQERINQMRMDAAKAEIELKGELIESVDLIETTPAQPERYHTEMGTLGKAIIWKYEIEDFALVPDEYKMLDSAKVGKVVRAGLRSIPGIRIYPDETLRVTPK